MVRAIRGTLHETGWAAGAAVTVMLQALQVGYGSVERLTFIAQLSEYIFQIHGIVSTLQSAANQPPHAPGKGDPSSESFYSSNSRTNRTNPSCLSVFAACEVQVAPSCFFTQLNLHFQKQLLHLHVLSYPASPQRGGLRRLARLVHRHEHDCSK